jgi:hypothetical protein
MSDTDHDGDGIRTQDLGYGEGADPAHGGGLGAALPATGTPATGTGEQVVDDGDTKPTSNTSSGSPSANSPAPSTDA